MKDNEQLIGWLNDAHAMEQTMLQVLEGHALLATDFPEIRAQLEGHRAQTLSHRDQIAQCLRALGQDPSTMRKVVATATGMAQGASTMAARDAVLRNALADYTAESAEIASYTALVTAAEESELPEIAAVCRGILDDEVEMAAWLEDRIPELTVLALAGVGR